MNKSFFLGQSTKNFLHIVFFSCVVHLNAISLPSSQFPDPETSIYKPNNVVIIGAGITGLVTGILLKQQGISVKIYEKRTALESIGGALSIWPVGSKVLLNLPCAPDILKLAGNLRFENWGDCEGKTLMTIDRELFRQINHFPFMNLCRSDLQQLLFTAFGVDDVIFQAKCTKITEDDQTVFAHFTNGDIVKADLLIGADGIFSTVRQFLFSESQLEYTGYIALVGIFPLAQPINHIIWGRNRLLLNFPISCNRHMIYAVRPLPQGMLKISKEEQIQLFRGWSKEVDQIMDAFSCYQTHPEFSSHYFCSENYDMEPLAHWHKNSVVLIGDAAHPMGSIMGFGANLALEDAKTLVDCLSSNHPLGKALEDFEQKRISCIQAFIEMESRKKNFLLHATNEEYAEFQNILQNMTPKEFVQPLFNIMNSE